MKNFCSALRHPVFVSPLSAFSFWICFISGDDDDYDYDGDNGDYGRSDDADAVVNVAGS